MSTVIDEKNFIIAKRLKDEREKKRVSQESLGVGMSASKRTVVNWEAGLSLPDARQLSVMSSDYGFDVLYIVTGNRMPLVAMEDRAAYQSLEVQSILEAFSIADEHGKSAIMALIKLIKSWHTKG